MGNWSSRRIPDRGHVVQCSEGARWNADRQAVEFNIEIGEYEGVVRVR
ncbi:MAG TPA: hypothetical protein VFW83_05440 [Bryobacteraceae bacterium]|nr:hypothetical protein [Bryobacteraceae bacterium]